MDKAPADFEADLHLSPDLICGLLLATGLSLFLTCQGVGNLVLRNQLEVLALLLHAASALAWLAGRLGRNLGRWLIIAALLALVELASGLLHAPELRLLLVVPTSLAAALSGPKASAVASVAASVLLLQPQRSAQAGLITGTALVEIWSIWGIMCAVYGPVQRVMHFAWDYLQNAQLLLQEARDRSSRLERAFQDLAHANRQLAMASERTAALRQVAETAQNAKADFAARVSHEFRAPLNMIIGLVGLMVGNPEAYGEALPSELRTDLEIVHRNSEHLASMINDVLDLSQVEAGRFVLHRDLVDLRQTIEGALEAVRPLVVKKHLRLEVACAEDLPLVYCDGTRIHQVILNLVGNAARFTVQGEVEVRAEHRAGHVLVSVRDTGPGIAPQDLACIFEPFWQASAGAPYGRGNNGLGLSICRQLVELHGGLIWLDSQLGKGTTCFVRLPVTPPPPHTVPPNRWIQTDWMWRAEAFKAARAAATGELLKPRLVVCDEAGALPDDLARYGEEAECTYTRDLAEAERELQRCPAHALIINSTDSDSLGRAVETARAIAPDTPIVGCTAQHGARLVGLGGVLGHITKPVSRADLEKAMRAVGHPLQRILLIDDDEEIASLLARMLHTCNDTLEVVTVGTGAEALGHMSKSPFDLVLLDIMLPDMDGRRVLERMRGDAKTRALPVFIVSALDPARQPLTVPYLLGTMGTGLSLSKLMRSSLGLSSLFLAPE